MSEDQNEGGIHIGSINASGGNVNVAGRDINIQQGGAEAIAKAFQPLLEKVSAMPEGPAKTVAKGAVEGLQEEAKKGDKAEEGKVQGWFSTLAAIAPDALEVAVSTFINPVQGLSLAFKKIAEKAQQTKAG